MIAPDLRMVDLDPTGFPWLCGLLARRDRTPTPSLQVLHDGGRVLNVVHTVRGRQPGHREPFDDPHARAAELLASTDVERVVLIDRSELDNLWAEIEAFARPEVTQPELLWASNDRFWSHPAVVTAPAAPRSPYPWVHGWFSSLGPDWWGLVGAWRDEELVLSVVFHVRDGLVRTVTSGEAFGWPRLPRRRAMNLVERAERLGPVPLAVLCDADALEAALTEPELGAALERLVDGAIHHRGIEAAP